MATILYGVAGEGNGHAVRSKVVIDHLKKKHKVLVFGGGNAYKYLSQFYSVFYIGAFRFVHRRNSVSIFRTMLYNLLLMPLMVVYFIRSIVIIAKIKPDIIITDLEPWLNYAAVLMRIPCISMSFPFLNNRYLDRYKILTSIKDSIDYVLTKIPVAMLNPASTVDVIPTFFHKEFNRKQSVIVPPIIRGNIQHAKPTEGDYILVYQTTRSHKKLLKALFSYGQPVIAYGFNKSGREKNVLFKGFDEVGFAQDIAGCKVVIANGGFSLMSECAYLKKPLLALPVKNRFEQILNGRYLEKLGYGHTGNGITASKINHFVKHRQQYLKHLKKQSRWTNKPLFNTLDRLIKRYTRKLTT